MTISATSATSSLARPLTALRLLPSGGVPVTNLKQLDAPLMALQKVPESLSAARLLNMTSMIHTMQLDGVTSDDAPDKLFAEVYKNGEVVARLYNGGSAVTYGKADGIVTGDDDPFDGGPKLAQWRANKIASAMGGTVKLASTAQTQSQWEISYAADQAKRDQAMAPYRAAMEAFRTGLEAATPAQASVTA
jgi:hypothetical protein